MYQFQYICNGIKNVFSYIILATFCSNQLETCSAVWWKAYNRYSKMIDAALRDLCSIRALANNKSLRRILWWERAWTPSISFCKSVRRSKSTILPEYTCARSLMMVSVRKWRLSNCLTLGYYQVVYKPSCRCIGILHKPISYKIWTSSSLYNFSEL